MVQVYNCIEVVKRLSNHIDQVFDHRILPYRCVVKTIKDWFKFEHIVLSLIFTIILSFFCKFFHL